MKKKSKYILFGIVILGVAIAGFGTYAMLSNKQPTDTKITIGSQGTDTVVWKHIADSKVAKQKHLNIEVKDFTDSNSLNKTLANDEIQVNAFQFYAFYTTYNKNNPDKKVYALGTTYIQPMGIYSGKYKSISSIPKNSTVAIANDAAAESRGLKLLESAGLVTLNKHQVDELVAPSDVKENPKQLKIKTVESTSTPSLLHDDGIAAVAIDNNTAQISKLDVFKDAIFHEKLDQNTKSNVNVIVTNKQHINDENYKKILHLYHDKKIQKWIKANYSGKVEINKSISELEK